MHSNKHFQDFSAWYQKHVLQTRNRPRSFGPLLTDAALLPGRCANGLCGQTIWTLLTLPAVRLVPVPPHRTLRALPAQGQLLTTRTVVWGRDKENALKPSNLLYCSCLTKTMPMWVLTTYSDWWRLHTCGRLPNFSCFWKWLTNYS